ncbi:MAG: FecR family protein [Candidatus Aminicenantes bacterium]|nr:FecR family protein [Candidatus Aminicenantes bacterium]
MGRKIGLIFSFLTVFLLFSGFNMAAVESIYGHISFVDNEAAVIRADGSENRLVVNLPVVPGDTVATSTNGRCELQFDNGTVIRLDENSRLRVTTVLAPALTSNWRVTTLHLLQGQAYALPQTYNREMFQIITPSAAINLKSRTSATIRIDADLGTSFFSDRGKFQVLYGTDNQSLKKITVKAGRAYAVSSANTLLSRVKKRDLEFTAWNEYVDRHFKELHYGVNKVPANLTKFKNKALLNWAEKWSSLFGEWIYDELFGYVWKPADERFALTKRPFFHADFVRINGQLFLVPQQQWGWVPAHMGTWVWLKRGWSWIPGEWFHPGIVEFHGTYHFPTLGYYWNMFHWSQPRPAGEPQWSNWSAKKPRQPQLPGPVVGIVKKIVKAADTDAGKHKVIGLMGPAFDGRILPPALTPKLPTPVPTVSGKADPVSLLHNRGTIGKGGEKGVARDWNPDSRWAARNGYSINYSSSKNAVVCPELKISSDRFRGVERMLLRGTAGNQRTGTYSPNAIQGQSGSSSSQSSNGTASGAATSNQGATGEHGKDDDKGK